MPQSSPEGKAWTVHLMNWLKGQTPLSRILDIGPGSGTYSKTLRPLLPTTAWVGVEAWAPYLEEYQLQQHYHQLVVCDARYLNFDKLGSFDIALMGDILEHMSREEALQLFQEVSQRSRFVLISIPIVHYPQEAIGGNPFERHIKDDWTHEEVLQTFPGIQAFVVHKTIGVYVAASQLADQQLLQRRNRDVQVLQKTIAHWEGSWSQGEGWFEIESGQFQGKRSIGEFQTFFNQHHQQHRDEIMGAIIGVKLMSDFRQALDCAGYAVNTLHVMIENHLEKIDTGYQLLNMDLKLGVSGSGETTTTLSALAAEAVRSLPIHQGGMPGLTFHWSLESLASV